jgi:hypothetical protein
MAASASKLASVAVWARGRCTEDAERSIGAAEQPDPGHDQRTDERDARGRAERAQQAASLSRRISEDRAGLISARIRRLRRFMPVNHEASVVESRPAVWWMFNTWPARRVPFSSRLGGR